MILKEQILEEILKRCQELLKRSIALRETAAINDGTAWGSRCSGKSEGISEAVEEIQEIISKNIN